MDKTYIVKQVRQAECNLEPLKCIHCGSLEVTFYQYQNDAHCAQCGEWQEGE